MLNTCEELLKNKILEGLIGFNVLELGAPIVLKIMIGIVTGAKHSTL